MKNVAVRIAIVCCLTVAYGITNAQSAKVQEVSLAKWTDPLTLPKQAGTRCDKWAKPWSGAKICVAHTYRWKYMDCKLLARISTPKPEALGVAIKNAIEQAAVKTALAELIKSLATGGASLASAGGTFTALLTDELHKVAADASVKLDQSCGWSKAR